MWVEFQLFWHVKYKLKSTIYGDLRVMLWVMWYTRFVPHAEILQRVRETKNWNFNDLHSKRKGEDFDTIICSLYFLHLIIIIHGECFFSLNWTNPHACSRHNLLLWRNIQWIKKYNKKEKLNRDGPTRHPTRHEQCEMRVQRIEHDKISRCD